MTLASQLALEATRREALQNFRFFVIEANRGYMKAQPEDGKALGIFHWELADIYRAPIPTDGFAKSVIWAPRKHLKTTMGLLWFLWRTATTPQLRLRYTMADRDLAREKSRQLVDIIQANPWMPHAWDRRQHWSGDLRQFTNGSVIHFGGWKSIKAGPHDHEHILDDILVEVGQGGMSDTDTWWTFTTVVLPSVTQRLILQGTPKRADDIYHRVRKLDGWKARFFAFPATIEVPRWPEGMPAARLRRLRADMGSAQFAREIMLRLTASETAMVPMEWLEAACDHALEFYTSWDPQTPGQVVEGVDLATARNTGDWTTFYIHHVDAQGHRTLLHAERHHGLKLRDRRAKTDLRRVLITHNRAFHPDLIAIEDNAFQATYVEELRQTTDLPVRGYTTTGAKHDRVKGINRLAILLENGKITFPYGPRSRPEVEAIIQGLNQLEMRDGRIRGHVDDYVMAMDLAERGTSQATDPLKSWQFLAK